MWARCGDIRFLWVVGCGCGWAPVRGFLCLFWCKNPHKGPCARYFLRDRKKTRKGKVPRVVKQEWGVSGQSGRGGRFRERQFAEGGAGTSGTQNPGQPRREDESAFPSGLCGEFSLGYMLVMRKYGTSLLYCMKDFWFSFGFCLFCFSLFTGISKKLTVYQVSLDSMSTLS